MSGRSRTSTATRALYRRLGSPMPSRHVNALGGIRTRDLRLESATTTPLVRQGVRNGPVRFSGRRGSRTPKAYRSSGFGPDAVALRLVLPFAVWMAGLEPAFSGSRGRRTSPLSHIQIEIPSAVTGLKTKTGQASVNAWPARNLHGSSGVTEAERDRSATRTRVLAADWQDDSNNNPIDNSRCSLPTSRVGLFRTSLRHVNCSLDESPRKKVRLRFGFFFSDRQALTGRMCAFGLPRDASPKIPAPTR